MSARFIVPAFYSFSSASSSFFPAFFLAASGLVSLNFYSLAWNKVIVIVFNEDFWQGPEEGSIYDFLFGFIEGILARLRKLMALDRLRIRRL
jgi:hypothetical protein